MLEEKAKSDDVTIPLAPKLVSNVVVSPQRGHGSLRIKSELQLNAAP